MITATENELLTKVGAGTPMGGYLREFWMPALRSAAVVAGADPVTTRLLGEDLVVYRLADGELGCLDEKCPHRQASLSLAHNDGQRLACIYHGWEFGAGGACLKVPTEPAARRDAFAARLQVGRHPVAESAGLIWVFLGDPENVPPLPRFEFTGLPEGHSAVFAARTRCNWLNCVEGLVDTVHTGQLHQAAFPGLEKVKYDSAPAIEVVNTDYGLRIGADRPNPRGGSHYYRITEWIAPFCSFVPQGEHEDRVGFLIVPVDDENTVQWMVWYDPEKPLAVDSDLGKQFVPMLQYPDDATELVRGRPKWGQDRATRGKDHFSGLLNLVIEDVAVQESQGTVMDRTREHLGSSDQGVAAARRMLAGAARKHAGTGEIFADQRTTDVAKVRGLAIEVEDGVDWKTISV